MFDFTITQFIKIKTSIILSRAVTISFYRTTANLQELVILEMFRAKKRLWRASTVSNRNKNNFM